MLDGIPREMINREMQTRGLFGFFQWIYEFFFSPLSSTFTIDPWYGTKRTRKKFQD